MTEIAFHFNVPDKLQYGCRLLRKAYLSGARVVVTAEASTLDALDQWLWRLAPTEFLPHCRAEAPAPQLAASPIVLAAPESLAGVQQQGVLVNLGQAIPAGFERFERFIELVSGEADDRGAARGRWKHYSDRGYAMKRHDLASAGDSA